LSLFTYHDITKMVGTVLVNPALPAVVERG